MITADNNLIDGVKAFIAGGGDVTTAKPYECFDHISKELHAHVTNMEREKKDNAGGEVARNVRYVFAKDMETLPTEDNGGLAGYDGWVTDRSNNAILITDSATRGTDRKASFETLDALHHMIDAAINPENAAIIIKSANKTAVPQRMMDIDPTVDYDIVHIPGEFNAGSVVEVNGIGMYAASDGWIKKYEHHIPVSVGGNLIATIEQVRGGHRRIYMMVSGPFNEKGVVATTLNPSFSAYADAIASIVNDEEIVVANAEFSEEDIASYRTAASILDIIKQTAASNKDIEHRLVDSLASAKDNIESAMTTISNMQKRINEEQKKLAEIQAGDTTHLVESTVSIIGEMNRISNDMPVKSCNLLRTEDGKSYFDIRLHPIVLDVEEEADRREDGERLIILEHMRLHLTLNEGGSIRSVIEWQKHDGYEDSDERRCHPHVQGTDGTACWGDAAPEIATAIGNGAWHDMMQWVYAWCGGYRVGDTVITFCENFPTAPEGAKVGWQIPAN